MDTRSLIALALESAIGAELGLFTVYLLSRPRRGTPALYLLAALSFSMGALVAGNLLIRLAGAGWLDDVLLLLDLLAPPLVFLYVAQMRWKARALAPADAIHALPAILGLAAWKSGLFSSMDIYVNACWFGYLGATTIILIRGFPSYAPSARQRFLVLLLTALLAIWLLRLVIVARANTEPSFREGLPYLCILAALFAISCTVLFTALHHPELLSVPGSHVKYGLLPTDESELDRLDNRLHAALSDARPFLDPDFSLTELAALLGASERQVSQLINARHGTNVAAYVNRHRVDFAAQLLLNSDKPIKAIPNEAGFRSKSVFNREFQRRFGMSPTAYRQAAGTAPGRDQRLQASEPPA